MVRYGFTPQGPFNLAAQREHFGGWPAPAGDADAIVMAFPVEGWQASAAVVVRQDPGELSLEVFGADDHQAAARDQALAALSLDIDGTAWPEIGRRDPRIGKLQASYAFLRPVLFHSAYEAAAHFIIGHRISMRQGRAIRTRMAEELGAKIDVDGEPFAAFPDPGKLLGLEEFAGLSATKVERLRGVAAAALAGKLDRAHLRRLSTEAALEEILRLDGVGPFFAAGILNRGAGLVDQITDDDLTKYAMQVAYELSEPPDQTEALRIAEAWKPYRMWAVVLLHVWLRREVGLPRRRR